MGYLRKVEVWLLHPALNEFIDLKGCKAMKIKKVQQMIIHMVDTDEEENYHYIRYGKNSWMVGMGESDE